MSVVSKITTGGTSYNIAGVIPLGTVDSTSTNVAFTATVSGITELVDGTAVFLRNNKVNSATNCTLDVNSLGAKPIYLSTSLGSTPARITSHWANGTEALMVYSTGLVTGGAWIYFVGRDTDTNNYVTQNAVNTNNTNYPVMLGYDDRTTAVTSAVNKAAALTYNPSTKNFGSSDVIYVGDGSQLTNLPGGTDVNVTQNAAITTAGEYPVILANSTATTAVTGTVNKTSTLKYNPNTQVLTTPKIAATTMTGILTCQNNTSYSTKQARNIFIISSGSSLPTGANGDVCLIY